jgi:hypothetical protein
MSKLIRLLFNAEVILIYEGIVFIYFFFILNDTFGLFYPLGLEPNRVF